MRKERTRAVAVFERTNALRQWCIYFSIKYLIKSKTGGILNKIPTTGKLYLFRYKSYFCRKYETDGFSNRIDSYCVRSLNRSSFDRKYQRVRIAVIALSISLLIGILRFNHLKIIAIKIFVVIKFYVGIILNIFFIILNFRISKFHSTDSSVSAIELINK